MSGITYSSDLSLQLLREVNSG